MSGSGVSARARSSPAAMLARKCRQRRVDRKGTDSRQLKKVLVGKANVAEVVFAEDGTDGVRVGIGIEQQVGLRLGLTFGIGEGLVQQVVENGAGGLGLVAVIVQEGLAGRGVGFRVGARRWRLVGRRRRRRGGRFSPETCRCNKSAG